MKHCWGHIHSVVWACIECLLRYAQPNTRDEPTAFYWNFQPGNEKALITKFHTRNLYNGVPNKTNALLQRVFNSGTPFLWEFLKVPLLWTIKPLHEYNLQEETKACQQWILGWCFSHTIHILNILYTHTMHISLYVYILVTAVYLNVDPGSDFPVTFSVVSDFFRSVVERLGFTALVRSEGAGCLVPVCRVSHRRRAFVESLDAGRTKPWPLPASQSSEGRSWNRRSVLQAAAEILQSIRNLYRQTGSSLTVISAVALPAHGWRCTRKGRIPRRPLQQKAQLCADD